MMPTSALQNIKVFDCFYIIKVSKNNETVNRLNKVRGIYQSHGLRKMGSGESSISITKRSNWVRSGAKGGISKVRSKQAWSGAKSRKWARSEAKGAIGQHQEQMGNIRSKRSKWARSGANGQGREQKGANGQSGAKGAMRQGREHIYNKKEQLGKVRSERRN